MNLLNIAPLRDCMQNYLRRSYIKIGNSYSVTDLQKPPRVLQLERRHEEELKKRPITDEEIRNVLKAFVGTAVHAYFERNMWGFANTHPQINYLIERKLQDKIADRVLVGKLDMFVNGIVYDLKTTSVWKYIYKQYKDFEEQLNIYAYLLRESDVEVNMLSVIMWFTDWDKWKAQQEKDYPSDPVVQVNLQNLWTFEKQRKFIEGRIERHKEYEKVPDNELPECTAEDMWAKPTKFAVVAPGKKKAVRLLDSKEQAQLYIKKSKNKEASTWSVEKRLGSRTRCDQYCKVREWCSQWQEYSDAS